TTSTGVNTWQSNAVSLHFALSQAYDYYETVHNHRSVDNDIKSFNTYGVINLGTNYANAYWNPSAQMFFFGNGDQVELSDLACGLDVVAHEYGHAVTSYSSQLIYEYQSGALNEAFSDYSGTMVEFYTSPSTANWIMGEGVMAYGSSYIGMRSMENPHDPRVSGNYQPAKMSEYFDLPFEQDRGGVHVNCTIPGHAIYLISQKVGRSKMEKIVYRAYIHYLTPQAQFIDFRLAAIQAANDLYSSTEANQVAQAFDEVEIFEGSGTKPPDPYVPVSGEDYILCVSQNTSQILNIKSEVPFKSENNTPTGVYTINKPSVSEDGSVVAYIDNNGSVNLYYPETGKNSVVDSQIKWHSIAISPDLSHIAMVPDTDEYPSMIGIIDMVKGESEFKTLYVSTTGEDAGALADYADILDWSNDGSLLLYDCCYSIEKPDGTTQKTWGLYATTPESETAVSLFTPSYEYSVGNPAFSNTKDYVIAFDYLANDGSDYVVFAYDLFEGELGVVHENVNTMGHPSFSPDDRKIVLQDKNSSNEYFLAQIDLDGEGLNGVEATYTLWVKPVKMPVWYATGERNTLLLAENFDTWKTSDPFPPENSGWWLSTTCAANTWRLGNGTTSPFNDIDPNNVYSAVVQRSETEDQKEEFYSPYFDLPNGNFALQFWTWYNDSYFSKYDLNVWVKVDGEWQEEWQLSKNGQNNFYGWQQFTIDLSAFQNKKDLRICWQYIGKGGASGFLDDVKIGIFSPVDETPPQLPSEYALISFPNPFNPTTNIQYTLPKPETVHIEIYNIAGQVVESITQKAMAGTYVFTWDAAALPSGVYFITLQAGAETLMQKCTLLK
ncbi:M4 family metallopeptidase, partial [candidate division KSB1 bacterium]|nr:M4 family metallopeptidase [candidate division KSB1 bacterium]